MRNLYLATLVFCTSLSAGCGCAGVGLSQVTPTAASLRVGESITLRYETGGACMVNNRPTQVELHSAPTIWHTSDTLIIALDTISGRVTGRAPGQAQIFAGGGGHSTINVQ